MLIGGALPHVTLTAAGKIKCFSRQRGDSAADLQHVKHAFFVSDAFCRLTFSLAHAVVGEVILTVTTQDSPCVSCDSLQLQLLTEEVGRREAAAAW
ncbi:hypothetical protein BaRGS_00000217 [Batillaria attramentaria]|uniref:Uncharacterized protein n=1 Tax=Batillaria attramentaria TaxID=370345 RepID=A0ABD0MCM3_9CAEN